MLRPWSQILTGRRFHHSHSLCVFFHLHATQKLILELLMEITLFGCFWAVRLIELGETFVISNWEPYICCKFSVEFPGSYLVLILTRLSFFAFLLFSDGKLEIVVPSFVHYLEVLEGSDGDKMPGTNCYLFQWEAAFWLVIFAVIY